MIENKKGDKGTVHMELVGESENIALFTIDQPKKANAYDNDMVHRFMDLLSKATANSSIRAAIITGSGGRNFCSGADTSTFQERSYEDALNLLSRQLFDNLANTPWPTIAAIAGPAVAGGFELALACDARICNMSSWFALPEVELGLIPAAGGITRLSRIVNEARAKEVIIFGRKVDCHTALDWGLVSQISEHVIDDALKMAEKIVKRDPLSTRLAKMALQSAHAANDQSNVDLVSQALLYYRNQQIH